MMFNSHTDELDQKIKKQREELSTLQQAADSVLQILNYKKISRTIDRRKRRNLFNCHT